jgi:hypothetical protein
MMRTRSSFAGAAITTRGQRMDFREGCVYQEIHPGRGLLGK